MKKVNLNFKRVFLIYLGVLLIISLGFLGIVYSTLSKYEKSQASYVIGEQLSLFQDAVSSDDISLLSAITPKTISVYEKNPDKVYRRLCEVYKGREFTYALSSSSFDSNRPVYILCADKTPIGQIQLSLMSETTKLGFLSVPDWAVLDFIINSDSFCPSYLVTAPKDYTLTINDITRDASRGTLILSDSSEDTEFYSFNLSGLSEKPIITAIDPFGHESECSFTPIKSDVLNRDIIQINVATNYFTTTLPSDFTVHLNHEPLSGSTENGFTTYSFFSSSDITPEYLNSILSVTDPVGDSIKYTLSKDGSLVPSYHQYELTIPSCFSVQINSVPFNSLKAVKTDKLSTEQYNESLQNLSTYHINLVKAPKIDILDETGSPVTYQMDGNKLYTPIRDYSVTIPENFQLLINHKVPNNAAMTTAPNPEYQYIKDYTEVPSLVTYTFPSLAKPPVITLTDNTGVQKNYTVEDALIITSQTGADALPDCPAAGVDALEIAKTWNLFMTDDLGGELSGYYKLRQYLIKDSYYDTVAYSWATGIDITFISDHVFRDPAFTKESVSNYVYLNETCFYCDVYFEKHMTLTRTRKAQDDTFYRRIFFVNYDDSNDGVDNPHWVIADMQDINTD